MMSTTKKELILVCIALVVLAISAYILMHNKQVDPVVDTSPDAVATSSVPSATEVKEFSYVSSSTSVLVEYIQFTNQLPKSVVAQLNLRIEKEAREMFNANKKELEEMVKGFLDTNTLLDGQNLVEDMKIDTVYVNADAGIASVAQELYSDTGGAHGSLSYRSSLYDLKTGKDLKLTDLLTGDYEKTLTAYIKDQIINQTPDCTNCDLLGGDIDPLVNNVISKSFVLDGKGITFLYGAYALGPYSSTAGGQSIHVPKEVLKDFIKREW